MLLELSLLTIMYSAQIESLTRIKAPIEGICLIKYELCLISHSPRITHKEFKTCWNNVDNCILKRRY